MPRLHRHARIMLISEPRSWDARESHSAQNLYKSARLPCKSLRENMCCLGPMLHPESL